MTTLVNDPTFKAIAAEIVAEESRAHETRVRYRDDLFGFCRDVLGYRDLLRRQDEVLPGSSHEDLCAWLQTNPSPFKLILMPRYSFKSCVVTMGRTLHTLMMDPNERILFYSDVNEKAEGFLDGVKNHLLGTSAGSTFRHRLGAWEVDPKKGVWNQQEIVVAPRTTAHVEPTVDTAGLETSKVGKHYDRLIFDDLVTDKNVTTHDLLEKVKQVYRKSLSLLKPGGSVLMLGTPWDFSDLYAEIQAKTEEALRRGDLPLFAIYKRPAEVDGLYPFAKIGLTKRFLQQQQAEQGSYTHSCLYQLQPVDEKTATFKASDFRFYDPATLPEGLFITCCHDPIPRQLKATEGDDAALTVVGTDTDRTMYLLEIVAGRLQPEEQIDALFRLHATWGFDAVGLEAIAFQREFRPAIEHRFEQERSRDKHFKLFSIREFTSRDSTKIHRIRGLQPYHERGAIRFPGTRLELLEGPYAKLASQMLKFPKSAQDDIVDSLADHIQIHRAGTGTPKVPQVLPRTSAAWFERQQQQQEVRALARRPRWNRPRVPALAFS